MRSSQLFRYSIDAFRNAVVAGIGLNSVKQLRSIIDECSSALYMELIFAANKHTDLIFVANKRADLHLFVVDAVGVLARKAFWVFGQRRGRYLFALVVYCIWSR